MYDLAMSSSAVPRESMKQQMSTRTDTAMSGAVASEMHDDSDVKGGTGAGPLLNWMKRALKSGEGRKKHETGDEESNGLKKA